MIRVGLVGIGGMGRVHFGCHNNNPDVRLAAICDVDDRKLAGDWSTIGLNVDTSKSGQVDLSALKTYKDYHDLAADPDIDMIDVCTPTPFHAPVAIAGLQGGKHVLCEKPMAVTSDECGAMSRAARESGKQLMIAHCLRFWPHYQKAHDLMQSGEYGKVLYARFHRSSATPRWSWHDWMRTPSMSGGCVLDMHIHDADTALWWFGKPATIEADGLILNDLPLTVDATWRYENGPVAHLYGNWDHNGGQFKMAYEVVMERATVSWDSSVGSTVHLYIDEKLTEITVSDTSGYQNEIDYFIDCISTGKPVETVTPEGSRTTVEHALEETRQIRAKGR